MSNAADVILRLLANSSDSKRSKRRRSRSSDEDISEGEMTERSDDDQDDDEDDEDGPVDEYDADLYGDAKDRANLMAMSEVDRERILFERGKKRDTLLDQRQIAKRLKKQEEASRSSRKIGASDSRDSTRRSTRAKDTKTGNTKALADLKKAQERKKRARRSHSPEQRRRRNGSVDYSDKSASSSSAESDYDSEPDRRDRDRDRNDKKTSLSSASREPATFEELRSAQLMRSQMVKWCHSPFFKDTVLNSFVRVNIGPDQTSSSPHPVYRIVEVISIGTHSKVYAIGNTRTNLSFLCKHGVAERTFLLDIFSDQPFTEDEFRRFENTYRREKVDLPTKEHAANKTRDIQAAKAYVLTNKEVDQILEIKKQMSQGKLNPVVHRTILEQQKSMMQDKDDILETERRLAALKEKEIMAKDQRTDKLDVWSKLNQRNRTINKKEGREAELQQAIARRLKGTGGRDIDPFARRKTTPRMVFNEDMTVGVKLSEQEASDTGASATPNGSSPATSGTLTPSTFTGLSGLSTVAAQTRLEEVIASRKSDFDIDIDMNDI